MKISFSDRNMARVCCILLLLATIFTGPCGVDAVQPSCAKRQRFDCLFNTPQAEHSQQKCRDLAPYCRWCPTLINTNNPRGCQTHDRACIVPDHIEIPDLNQQDCENQGYVYCWGDGVQKCVQPEPARKICFRKNDPKPCTASGDLTTEAGCHSALCVWCGAGSKTNTLDKCWATPAGAACTGGGDCCQARTCFSDLSQCLAKGCKFCQDGEKTICVFGQPDEPVPAVCPTLENSEDCFAGITADKTEQLCEDLCCTWCLENGVPACRRDNYPTQCSAAINTLCPTSGLDTCPDCKAYGCEWCGPQSTSVECQYSTTCTTCSCTSRTECCAATPQACELKGCMWCEDATDFKCMNVDSSGAIGAGVWTECTKTCGAGSQWQYDPNCPESSFFMCPRIHRSCNTEACPITICPEGEMPRHVESGTCCMSHTWSCGRNTFNTFQATSGGGGRRKRVVGGQDIMSIENYPWMVVIYINGTMKCTGTVVSNQHVVTHSSCVTGASQIEVLFNQYDRTVTRNITRGSSSVTIDSELAVILLDAPLSTGEFHPLCLPGGEFPLQDTDCIMAGWGLTDASDSTECVAKAHAATVRTMPWGLCAQAWDWTGITEDDYFCAGIPEGGPDACTGDKGGALMCQRCANCAWYFAGLAIPYVGCGVAQTTSVFAKIAKYESTLLQSLPVLDPGPYSCP